MNTGFFLFFYLLRDTLHRWRQRLSSPLSRILVVFTLSLFGLLFLSSYAFSIHVLNDKITNTGIDLIIASEFVQQNQTLSHDGPSIIAEIPDECEVYIFYELFLNAKVDNKSYQIVEYTPKLTGLLPKRDYAIYVLPEKPVKYSGITDIEIEKHKIQGRLLEESEAGFLRKLYRGGAVFIPSGASPISAFSYGMMRKYVLRIPQANVDKVTRWEEVLSLISRLDERNMVVISGKAMLEEMEQLKAVQMEFRIGIVLGSCCVICILLTSISGMDFRQNEYVYALMGSFGINRFILFLTFLSENTILVFGGFSCALLCLNNTGQYLIARLYRLNDYVFSLDVLHDDIMIFFFFFIICIFISSMPILPAIFRPIGKILK